MTHFLNIQTIEINPVYTYNGWVLITSKVVNIEGFVEFEGEFLETVNCLN